MASFAIIAEGPTDQRVIENIVCGFMSAGDGPLVVNDVQPPPNSPGGWTLVLSALRDGEVGRALKFNDYVIVHIDTDVCDQPGFDVPRRIGGRELSTDELTAAVAARLASLIGEVFESQREHILFAIAVDSIECWLLPILFESQTAKAAKSTGCMDAANDALRAANRPLLKKGDDKLIEGYRACSADYLKKKVLLKHSKRNPSLKRFVAELEEL